MGTLFVVATPIGNLNDFSKRAIDTLKESDLILVEDTRQTIKLLNHFDINVKMLSYHKFNEKERVSDVIKLLNEGKNISLVSDAGTPCISDPGYILIKEALENDIKVIGIPGCSAVITALSVSGLDTSSFSFYGFVPTENKPKKELFERIKHSSIATKVIYESPKRIIKLLEYIKKEIPGCVVSVCNELTKIHEHIIHGKIEEVYEKMKNDPNSFKGEYVVLINNEPLKKETNVISIEALLVDLIIKNKCTLKEAIKILNEENKNISKKDIYNASIKLKNIIS